MAEDMEEMEHPGLQIQSKIRQEPGRMKQTNISINGYEMHEMELLDRGLIAIQRTEDAFIDINNRIISNVNSRKARLNNLNQRISTLANKTMSLYNCNDPMRIESPAEYPKISTFKSPSMHPHQSIFYERQNVLDEGLLSEDPVKTQKSNNEEFNLPELFSMQMNRKIQNTRLQNKPENLGNLVTGITKDIQEISGIVLSLEKYGTEIHNLQKDIQMEA